MSSRSVLLCRVGARRCALPLDVVIETMRPLPTTPVMGATVGVLGAAVIRGTATPVVDLAALFEDSTRSPARFVTIRTGPRVVALAVDEVIGVQSIDSASLRELPPLLGDARTSTIERIGAADAQLLVVLRAANVLPADVEVQP